MVRGRRGCTSKTIAGIVPISTGENESVHRGFRTVSRILKGVTIGDYTGIFQSMQFIKDLERIAQRTGLFYREGLMNPTENSRTICCDFCFLTENELNVGIEGASPSHFELSQDLLRVHNFFSRND